MLCVKLCKRNLFKIQFVTAFENMLEKIKKREIHLSPFPLPFWPAQSAASIPSPLLSLATDIQGPLVISHLLQPLPPSPTIYPTPRILAAYEECQSPSRLSSPHSALPCLCSRLLRAVNRHRNAAAIYRVPTGRTEPSSPFSSR